MRGGEVHSGTTNKRRAVLMGIDVATDLEHNVEAVRDGLERAYRLMSKPDDATAEDLQGLADERGIDVEDFLTLDIAEAAQESLEDFLEIVGIWEGTSRGEADFKGCRVVYCIGGPHVELVTRKRDVIGYWGGEQCRRGISSDVCDYFDAMLEDQ